MVEVVYKEKTFLNTSTTTLDNKKHMKESTCPYYNISTDATRVGIKSFTIENGLIADVTYKCTSCDKVFHVSYVKLNDENMLIHIVFILIFKVVNLVVKLKTFLLDLLNFIIKHIKQNMIIILN